MLQLYDICKDYISGEDTVHALKDVHLAFRKNEFVSVLGPSGCGKTTLLNIIGGLDHYSSGDLFIRGKSTRDFQDPDWDSYRNHSIGFVFQSYNLIPHQSILSNVELALTLSGVSKSERRQRAKIALEKVGLKDQIKKRPNQLSGGQMQRVAIARALVNDPEILLADEPTGALDTATSLQIMELLKEISGEKLVIMVTHNSELATRYSTRIIKLLDGRVIDDSNPFNGEGEEETDPADDKKHKKKQKKPSMSLFTAIALSTNNLMTKKGRTVLTSFAGSIGIIGIALILALSNGINTYINTVQEESLSSYPITIQAESVDMSALMTSLMGINRENEKNQHDRDAVYSSGVMYEMLNSINNPQVKTNNLSLFKEFLEKDELIRSNITHLQYSYDLNMSVFTKDENGKIVKSDMEGMMEAVYEGMGFSMNSAARSSLSGSSSLGMGFGSIKLWQEMLPDSDGTGVSSLLKDQYDVIFGSWPKAYDEAILVVDKNNELSDAVLCGLGLKTTEEVVEEMQAMQRGEELDTAKRSWTYEELCQKEFKVFLPSELYQKNPAGTYTLLSETEKGMDYLYGSDKGVAVKICGIIRAKKDSNSQLMTGVLGYTADLTQSLLKKVKTSEIIQEQQNHPEQDILLGLPFLPEDFVPYSNEEKASLFREYALQLDQDASAELFVKISSIPSEEYLDHAVSSRLAGLSRQEIEALVMENLTLQEESDQDISYISDYIAQMSDEELFANVQAAMKEMLSQQYAAETEKKLSSYPAEQLRAMLLAALQDTSAFTAEQFADFYDRFMPPSYSENTLEQNLKDLGFVEEKSPSAISIYTDSFAKKEAISGRIKSYNKGKSKEDKIEYTDIVEIIMSGFATVINAISYVLIAFVSISLVVSSIMIGIITYISVLERTKEIGILRAIGASKKDVSRVFNAESMIVGFFAGVIGIGLTLLLILPINALIRTLTGIQNIGAILPLSGYFLILVSIFLSFIAGLFPARFAARKDPVEALRAE